MKHRQHSHVWPIYGPGENLFTCEFYHGGTIFMDHEKIRCIGDPYGIMENFKASKKRINSLSISLGSPTYPRIGQLGVDWRDAAVVTTKELSARKPQKFCQLDCSRSG